MKLPSYRMLAVLLFTMSSFGFSPHLSAKPVISWTPKKINIDQMQGAASSHDIIVESAIDTSQLVARVVPEFSQWVTVSPSSFDGLQAGQQVVVNISINLPLDAPAGTFDGVVQLRQSVIGKPEKVLAKPLPISLAIIEVIDGNLPPDPGEAGKLTLLGIDSDDDGVRDDIQRYIYFTYPSQEKVKIALTEVAKQWQILLSQSGDPQAAFNNATKMARHGECLDYFEGEMAEDILSSLRAETLNTRERSVAYINYSDSLGGEIVLGRPLAEWGNSCAFDVDAIGAGQ